MWSKFLGLKIASSLAIPRIIVESDSKVAVEDLLAGLSSNPSIRSLVNDILHLQRMNSWMVEFKLVNCGANVYADAVAHRGFSSSFEASVFDVIMSALAVLVQHDFRVSNPRVLWCKFL